MGENTGSMSGLLFAYDTTLMTESESNLQRYVSAFVRVCERRKPQKYGCKKMCRCVQECMEE